jgi:signal transduction histidine kinase
VGKRLAVLLDASRELGDPHDAAQILESLVRLVVPSLGDACSVHVFEPGGTVPTIRRVASEAVDGRPIEWWDRLDAVTRPSVRRALRSATSEIRSKVRTLGSVFGELAYMTVPLRARGQTLGALTLVALEARQRYTPDDLVVAQALGAQAGLALDNARMCDEQPQRIARELHDHAEQTFFVIGLTARTALRSTEHRLVPAAQLTQALTQVDELAAAGAEQLRTAIFALSRAEFGGAPLGEALRKLSTAFQTRTGIETDLVLTGQQRPIPADVAEVLHAVTRESLANVERHAHAGAVVLGLHIGPRSVRLTVQDDGTGGSQLMLKQIAFSSMRFGLRGMRDRVCRLRGTLVAGPGPDGGFLVRVRIPLRSGAAA